MAKRPRKDEREPSFRAAMRELIAPRFAVVWKEIPVAIEGVDPAGVHDVRVASRRLRAAMDVAGGCFPAKWFKPLHRSVKEITGALGEVRDRDVLLEFLVKERDSASAKDRPGVDRLIARVERERESARAEMIDFLESIEKRDLEAESARRFGAAAAAGSAPPS